MNDFKIFTTGKSTFGDRFRSCGTQFEHFCYDGYFIFINPSSRSFGARGAKESHRKQKIRPIKDGSKEINDHIKIN
jgi:hypothetical protein